MITLNMAPRQSVKARCFTVSVTLLAIASCGLANARAAEDGPLQFEALTLDRSDPPELETSIRKGHYRLTIVGPRSDAPDAVWQGPVHVDRPAASATCTIAISLVERIYLDRSSTALLIFSRSGSTTYIQAFGTKDYVPFWPEIAVVGGEITVSGHEIDVAPVCIATDSPTVFDCFAARAFDLDRQYQLLERPTRAGEATRRRTGLSFTGRAFVRAPGTPAAAFQGAPIR